MTTDPVPAAIDLASRGQVAEAAALLDRAGDDGNVDALMQLAVWRLVGAPLPRDLAAARTLLRRATAIGHVDAALMEIALTANGSGGPADWGAAHALLERAAADDPVAADQLALLTAMALTGDGSPREMPVAEPLSRSPNVWIVRGLLSAGECAHVANTGMPLLEPASVIDSASGKTIAHPVRTAHGGAIGPAREDLVIRALNLRIAAISGTAADQGEPLTVLHYAVGQQYRPHVDTIPAARNQRVKTVLVYLNEGYRGGETQFLANGLTLSPRAGDAVMFDNVVEGGAPDLRSRHAGMPVTAGSKWLATRWIRAATYDPWHAG